MKKKLGITLLLASLLAIMVACGTGTTEKAKDSAEPTKELEVIKVASHLPPMVDIVKLAGEAIQKDGYTIELVQVNDNIQYNDLLANEEVDANFAQHQPFMAKYNQEKDAHLVAIQKIYNAKVGFYAKTAKTLEEIPEGSKVALPSDVSNEGRALAILADVGLITLKDGVGFEGTIKDIEDNPKNLERLSFNLLKIAKA